MGWLARILIGLGIVLALLIAIVVMMGQWTPSGPTTQALSMTVGNRTVTVSGHYKNMKQESLADGIKVVVDGHEISVTADQLTVDGKTQVLEPDQDVQVYVNEAGGVEVKLVHEDAASSGTSGEATEGEGASP